MHCIDEAKMVLREAFTGSGQHSFRKYDVPTGNFAVPCSISFSAIKNILGRHPVAEFL